jgi:hypothetical protein
MGHPFQGFDCRERAESCSYLIHGIGKRSRVELIAVDDRLFDGILPLQGRAVKLGQHTI